MIRTAFFALAALGFTAPALAHDDAPPAVQVAVSQEQAVAIAQSRGVISVREVKLDEGNWEIEGLNKEGRKIEIEVSAATGEVVKLELY